MTKKLYYFLFLTCSCSSEELLIKVKPEHDSFRRKEPQTPPPLAPFTCRAKVYENTLHQGDFLYSWKNVPSLYDCIGHCFKFTTGRDRCRAVNYFSKIRACDLLSRPSRDPSLEPAPPNAAWISVQHAVIVWCQNHVVSPTVETTETPPPSFQLGECGKQYYQPNLDVFTSSTANRIVHGNEAIPHSWPWVVGITYFGKLVCAGTVISLAPGLDESDMVLTAAHCLKDGIIGELDMRNLAVLVGVHSRPDIAEDQIVLAESLHWHEYFMSDPTYRNDIGLIKLKRPIKFSSKVLPVCLPNQRDATPLNSTCVTAGWGRYKDANDTRLSDTLQQLRVPIIDSAKCKDPSVWGSQVNTITMICAGSIDGNQNVCHGDSGGALMCLEGDHWVQQGVVSFVYRQDCTAPKKPGIYTRVSMYRYWIDQKIEQFSTVVKRTVMASSRD